MKGDIKRAVLRRIMDERRVSRAVASTIYGAWPIRKKQAACVAEERRRARARNAEGQPS